jgi:hemoglobin-like flavoprotein
MKYYLPLKNNAPMTGQQIQLVQQSWQYVSALNPVTVGTLFYTRLFEIAPEVQPMFRAPVPEQSKKLLAMISYVISKLDRLDEIVDEVGKLAQRHVQYGVQEKHYTIVGVALLWTLERGLDKYWNEDLKAAWVACYGVLSGAMIQASAPVKAV